MDLLSFLPVSPPSWAKLLGPDIRQRLHRYGSMRTVKVTEDEQDLIVFYTLITSEARTIRIPLDWIYEERYGEIRHAITQYLGAM